MLQAARHNPVMVITDRRWGARDNFGRHEEGAISDDVASFAGRLGSFVYGVSKHSCWTSAGARESPLLPPSPTSARDPITGLADALRKRTPLLLRVGKTSHLADSNPRLARFHRTGCDTQLAVRPCDDFRSHSSRPPFSVTAVVP